MQSNYWKKELDMKIVLFLLSAVAIILIWLLPSAIFVLGMALLLFSLVVATILDGCAGDLVVGYMDDLMLRTLSRRSWTSFHS